MDEAVEAFNMMVEKGFSPDLFSYNILINGYCKSKQIDEAMRLFHEMSNKGIIPDVWNYNTLIGGFFSSGKSPNCTRAIQYNASL